MNANTSAVRPGRKLSRNRVRLLLSIAIYLLFDVAILAVLSGRLDWVMVWAYFVVLGVGMAILALVAPVDDPEFVENRSQIKEGTKEWDKPIALILSVAHPLATLIVAGLDMRLGWSPPVPLALQIAALIVIALGSFVNAWALLSNKFYSRFVRIQTERGHTVVTGGPYRFVRHPGYAGGLLGMLVTPLVFSSLWAFVPVVLVAALTIVRTALEDRTLQAELDGYKDYARKVRYRLLPGVW
jgi:protein-S-isoprenylcysteine O-methyltransferase Ste14